MEQSLVGATCFLCEEGTRPLYRVCACDQHVHERCYLRLLTVPSHTTHCAVCRTPYDLDVKRRYRVRWSTPNSPGMAIYIGGLATVGILSFTYASTTSDATQRLLFHAVGAIMIGGIVGMAWIHRVLTAHTLCCGLRRVVVHKTAHLPPPVASDRRTCSRTTEPISAPTSSEM